MPQDIALADASKGIVMFAKVPVLVLGIVEKMSMHICSYFGHLEAIFGCGDAEKLEKQYQCVLLGQLLLHISPRENLHRGTPTVVSHPKGEFTEIYRQLTEKVVGQLYWQGRSSRRRLASKPFKNIYAGV